jgi:adenosylcobinamide-GDP ribazoletransferase
MILKEIRHFFIALQFFTRIPVTGKLAQWVGFNSGMLRASAAYFPLVGWVIGGIVAFFSTVLLLNLPTIYASLVAAVLGTVLSVLLTGAFHEDGLADVADGLGGSYDRAQSLIIMKDSRVGAFGAIAVALALSSKVALLALLGAVNPIWFCAGIWSAHILSRTLPLLIIYFLPYIGDESSSKSKPLADQISKKSLLIAMFWMVLGLGLSIICQRYWAMPIFEISIVLTCAFILGLLSYIFMAYLFNKRLQGFNGDCLGATQQVVEIAFYLGLSLGLGAI